MVDAFLWIEMYMMLILPSNVCSPIRKTLFYIGKYSTFEFGSLNKNVYNFSSFEDSKGFHIAPHLVGKYIIPGDQPIAPPISQGS